MLSSLSSAIAWIIGGVLVSAVVYFGGMSIAAGSSRSKSIRKQWTSVLDAEAKRWSDKSCAQLILDVTEGQAYEVEFESKRYQVEVELLEDTPKYIHVALSVDDGSLPASIRPLSRTFLRYKDESDFRG